jgi:CRP/FNR family transcriptional regulator, cyclic AMP receptor protein
LLSEIVSSKIKYMKYSSDDYYKICSGIPFLACLSKTELAEIESVVIVKKFLKNQVILLEEDEPSYFYFIVSGRVKVIRYNEAGKELMLAIHKRYDYFGEMAILDGKTSPATIIAMEDCTIGFITKSNFVKFIMSNERSLQQLISLLCSRLRESWSMLNILGFAEASEKVRAALKIFSKKFGTQDSNGTIISIKLTHKDLANFAAVSRETASRIISSLTKAGEIELVDNKYFLLKPSFFNKPPIS